MPIPDGFHRLVVVKVDAGSHVPLHCLPTSGASALNSSYSRQMLEEVTAVLPEPYKQLMGTASVLRRSINMKDGVVATNAH